MHLLLTTPLSCLQRTLQSPPLSLFGPTPTPVAHPAPPHHPHFSEMHVACQIIYYLQPAMSPLAMWLELLLHFNKHRSKNQPPIQATSLSERRSKHARGTWPLAEHSRFSSPSLRSNISQCGVCGTLVMLPSPLDTLKTQATRAPGHRKSSA